MKKSREQQDVRRRFARLMRAKRYRFPSHRERLFAPPHHGVYVVFGPGNRILHVGRTVRGKRGLLQRLTDHLRGNSSFTASSFQRDGSKLRGKCSYAFLTIKDARSRVLLESYAVGFLCPKHLGLGGLLAGA